MLFLSLIHLDVQFDTGNLTWKTYSTTEALATSRQIELIDKHNFARAALDENSKTFVVHVTALEALELTIHPSWNSVLAALQ